MARNLSAEDWAAAALRALAAGGPRAVAVEPIASALGTTKGSFYWHFASRAELLDAALARWEQGETEAVMEQVDREPDPWSRLRALLLLALESATMRSTNAVELGLQADASNPQIAPILERVTRRRLGYLSAQFVALGFDEDEASRRGLLAYTAYLGHAQMTHATPGLAPTGEELRVYADHIARILTDR
jgi:AcrR family transcriptional regulator